MNGDAGVPHMGERLSAKHHLNFMTLASFGSTMVPMNHSRTTLVMLALFATSLLRDGDLLGAEPVAKVDYITQIKPLLNTKCYSCHGALKQESELRLETRSLMLTGGEGGAVIVSGRSKDSPLFQRITADKDERMPPESEGSPLTADEISLLRNWIDQGAIAPVESIPAAPRDHWSFQSVVRPAVPKISDPRWSENPVDAFLAQRHQQLGLVPQQEAPRIILLRRLYLDLIGVPPTNEEIIAFENDKSDDWYEKTVQHLLDDPRHGQRWGRHWMDVWRYSDWWGLGAQLRNSQKHIWHWRDWIVESVNEDTPYDEMVRLMLAADELHPNDLDKLRATGYLARNYFLFNRPQWMEETVEHVGKGFLGLTMNCAKCHDHKFDPIEQADFYRMRAFFEPYHVRLDVVPGEADLDRDGIPRVFDGLPDEPTYIYIRGDEKNPDKTKLMTPGVPKLLAFREIKIEPVKLPAASWQPGRRPWVAEAHIALARKKLATAEAALKTATAKLKSVEINAAKVAAEKPADAKATNAQPTEAKPAKAPNIPLVTDDFKTLDKKRWTLFAGQWVHQPGKLEQKKDGATRAALRLNTKLPRDFEAIAKFTILGGSKWRSVGISFDGSDGDPTLATAAGYHEQQVYVSAYAGGSKVHASYNSGGKWYYPPGSAIRKMPIALNQEYTLRLRVRGSLINASLNGQPVIAARTPLARRDGVMQLTTFDVLAVFHEFKVTALSKDISLREPTSAPLSPAIAETDVAGAKSAVQVAQAFFELTREELTSIERRAEALQADEKDEPATRIAAVNAARQMAVFKSKHNVAIAEQKLLRAAADKKAAVEKALQTAQAALAKAETVAKSEVKPTDKVALFMGAKWTPTRFFNSGRDDKAIEFRPESTGRRTALANWITDRRNPLTARVAANQIWMRHMGQPLVPTVFDFGRKGTPPTNPELLDWLASELMENGWSMKHLHKVIVTSSAYRMSSSSAGVEANIEKDRDNRHWWRRVPIRLESQVVRDSILAMSGSLESTMGGPPVPRAMQASSNRRSMYFFHSNNERNLFLSTFDEALVQDCYRREQSIVPQQALALTNSQLVLDSSQKIAKLLSDKSAEEDSFIRSAFALVIGVEAGESEIEASKKAMQEWRELAGGSIDRARANLVWALINLNDFVTLR